MALYHYCSQNAFLSIVTKKSFWCSALSLSNDTMEGRWVHEVFSGICDLDNLRAEYKNRVMEMLRHLNSMYEGLGFCLSERGDTLSQWRGYAQDAEGFCIGFDKEGIVKLADATVVDGVRQLGLYEVNYDIDKQRAELEPTYSRIKKLIDRGAFQNRFASLLSDEKDLKDLKQKSDEQDKALREISLEIFAMLPMLFIQKNPAFVEEKEWRVISSFIKDWNIFKSGVDGIEFRSVGDRIVPYRSFQFQPESGIIVEVILGPKNQTPTVMVEVLLKKLGYENVSIRKSKATYR